MREHKENSLFISSNAEQRYSPRLKGMDILSTEEEYKVKSAEKPDYRDTPREECWHPGRGGVQKRQTDISNVFLKPQSERQML